MSAVQHSRTIAHKRRAHPPAHSDTMAICTSLLSVVVLVFICFALTASSAPSRGAAVITRPAETWQRHPDISKKRVTVLHDHLPPEVHTYMQEAGLIDRVHNYYRVCNNGSSDSSADDSCSNVSFYASGVGTVYHYFPPSSRKTIESSEEHPPLARNPLSAQTVWEWREMARDMLSHAFGNYMRAAYPWDELKPISCDGRKWTARERGTLDDSLGGFALTLIDSLDTLALTGDLHAFRCGVSMVVQDVRFDNDVQVSVFETSIRVIGGLLSAHLLASDPRLRIFNSTSLAGTSCPTGIPCLTSYRGELLHMALELADRLMPAFDTPSGVPVHRINLKTGEIDPNSRHTCAAAGGTFLLEWGLLSVLSGDQRYGAVARRAMSALWGRRSPVTGLIGSSVDAFEGAWQAPHTGVGAGVDSYYEYLLKSAVAFDDPTLMHAFNSIADSVEAHLSHAGVHVESSFSDGRPGGKAPVISALQAFYPGLEVLAGRVVEAEVHFLPLFSLWNARKALPEALDVTRNEPLHFAKDAPLRPELLESTYYLYTATGNPAYLEAAAAQLLSLNNITRVKCGFASIADVDTRRLDDRMDSYFIAETIKYAFLIFDHALTHWQDGPNSYSNSSTAVLNAFGEAAPGISDDAAAAAARPRVHPLANVRARGAEASIMTHVKRNPNIDVSVLHHDPLPAALRLDDAYAVFTTEGHVIDLSHPQLRANAGLPTTRCASSVVVAPHKHAQPVSPHTFQHAGGLDSERSLTLPPFMFGIPLMADFFVQSYIARRNVSAAVGVPLDECAVAAGDVSSGCSAFAADGAVDGETGTCHFHLSDSQLPPFESVIAPAVRDALAVHQHGLAAAAGASVSGSAKKVHMHVRPVHAAPQQQAHLHEAQQHQSPAESLKESIARMLEPYMSPERLEMLRQFSQSRAFTASKDNDHDHSNAHSAPPNTSPDFTPVLRRVASVYVRAIENAGELGHHSSWTQEQFDGVLADLNELLQSHVQGADWTTQHRELVSLVTEADVSANWITVLPIIRHTTPATPAAAGCSDARVVVAQAASEVDGRAYCARLTLHGVPSAGSSWRFETPGWSRLQLSTPQEARQVLNAAVLESDCDLQKLVFSPAAAFSRVALASQQAFVISCKPHTSQCAVATNASHATDTFVLDLQWAESPMPALQLPVSIGVFAPLPTAAGLQFDYLLVSVPFDACTPIQLDSVPKRHQWDGLPPHTALLVARGGCTFAEKARHAQQAGAVAVLVVDTEPLMYQQQHTDASTSHTSSDSAHPVDLPDGIKAAYRPWHPSEMMLGGDGVNNVHIPTMFVAGQSAAVLVQQLRLQHERCSGVDCTILDLHVLSKSHDQLQQATAQVSGRVFDMNRYPVYEAPVSMNLSADFDAPEDCAAASNQPEHVRFLSAVEGGQAWSRGVHDVLECFACLSDGDCHRSECYERVKLCAQAGGVCSMRSAAMSVATVPALEAALPALLQHILAIANDD